MNKKLFVVSDVHSFYTPLKKALDESGFNPNNENHWLIVCGDAFDRGDESVEVLHYLMSLERKILVRGNHDDLLEECLKRGFPFWHDHHNGTRKTINDIGGAELGNPFDECCRITWDETADYRGLLQNYFETKNYIFVHSWIPTTSQDKYDRNWRRAGDKRWSKAMWGNPFELAQDGLNKTGKTIIMGHWHCSAGYALNDNEDWKYSEFDENACWESYVNEQQGIIGIDRCTAHTGKVNVLVLEDEFLDDEIVHNHTYVDGDYNFEVGM